MNKNPPVDHKVYANYGNAEVLKHVPKDISLRVLDVGCGAGDNAHALNLVGHAVYGVTLSDFEAVKAREHCQDVQVYNLEQGLPSPYKSDIFDVVICSHVLEHICFPESLMRDVIAVLRPGGKLIVALPNLVFIRNRWALLRGRVEYQQSGLMDNTHFRWYTFQSSASMIKSSGFSVKEHYVTGYVPLGVIRRLLPKTGALIDQLLCRLFPGLFGYQIVLVAEKIEDPQS